MVARKSPNWRDRSTSWCFIEARLVASPSHLFCVLLVDSVTVHESKAAESSATEIIVELLFMPAGSAWFNAVEDIWCSVEHQFYASGSIAESFASAPLSFDEFWSTCASFDMLYSCLLVCGS